MHILAAELVLVVEYSRLNLHDFNINSQLCEIEATSNTKGYFTNDSSNVNIECVLPFSSKTLSKKTF